MAKQSRVAKTVGKISDWAHKVAPSQRHRFGAVGLGVSDGDPYADPEYREALRTGDPVLDFLRGLPVGTYPAA
jgi:hypothetical protein